MKRKIIIIFIIIAAAGIVFGGYKVFFSKKNNGYSVYKAEKGTVVKEISESGVVGLSDETSLGFKNSGRIEKIYVEKGDKVEKGQDLAKLDSSQLEIQLREASASLEIAQANLDKLMTGATKEETDVLEAAVSSAQVALENAQQSLKDTQSEADNNLKNDYEGALDTLNDCSLKIYNAYNSASLIQRTYFLISDQEGIRVRAEKDKIEQGLNQVKSFLTNNLKNEDIDTAISESKKILEQVNSSLEIIRSAVENALYRDVVSSADKTILDTQRTNITTASTNLISAQQAIANQKTTNEKNINTAKAVISSAQAQLNTSKAELELKKAAPRQEDINLYQARKREAQANVSLLRTQIEDAVLKSPNGGQITRIDKREGEVVQALQSFMTFLPQSPFQVEVDIYEEDIVNVRIGNPAKVTIAAFPDKILEGTVSAIDPAEKLIEGVVYYKVTIDFDESGLNIKPGMTADIVIETEKKENVLVVPRQTLNKTENKTTVKILKQGKIEERQIEIGLEGSNDMVEVVSGLKVGEEVVVD